MESPAESMALRIPMCARPFAPPPLSVSPIFGLLDTTESWAADGMFSVRIRQPEIIRVRIKIINGFFLIALMVYIKLNKDREMEFQILHLEFSQH
jgi:hypothetical protein